MLSDRNGGRRAGVDNGAGMTTSKHLVVPRTVRDLIYRDPCRIQ